MSSTEKKYEFTGETKTNAHGVVLRRIRATASFFNVRKGELGGWIEDERNLSRDDNAWVYGDAQVFGDAWVGSSALVYGAARIYDSAQVSGHAHVYDSAQVYGDAKVHGDAQVYGDAKVHGNACVYEHALVFGDTQVYGYSQVRNHAIVFEDAKVHGKAEVCGNAYIRGNACVCDIADYMVFKNCWSSGRFFTYTLSNKKWSVGCFYGTGNELIKKAYLDSEKSGRCYETIVKTAEAIAAFAEAAHRENKKKKI